MPAPPDLTTDRLHLRAPKREDAPAIFAGYGADPEVTRYLVWRPHQSVADAEAFIGACHANMAAGHELPWAIMGRHAPDAGQLLGMIALRLVRPTPAHDGVPAFGAQGEVGYVLGRQHWGRGVVTEALRAVLAYAFDELGLERVQAICDLDNPASARVMAKAGLRPMGVLPRYIIHPNVSDAPRDVYCYHMDRSDWGAGLVG